MIEDAAEATEYLALSAAEVPMQESLECRIAEVLAIAPQGEALLAREIQMQLGALVGDSRGLADIRSLLRSKPCFVEGPRHRWRLGRGYVAPRRVSDHKRR